MRTRSPFRTRSFDRYDRDLEEYREMARKFGGFELDRKRIYEIGCGQRPYRLFWLRAYGLNATAIDMDKVVFRLRLADIVDSFRLNGFERTLKTVIRYLLFDLAENKKFRRKLSNIQGSRFDWPLHIITQGDATDPAAWPVDEIDFIYSEDVFEHVPAEVLPELCAQVAASLSDIGIALIRPMIFTGIQGGHNVE